MNETFKNHLEEVTELFNSLDSMASLEYNALHPQNAGVYVFIEKGIPQRVGRANNLRKRIKGHSYQNCSSGCYAFKCARGRLENDPELWPALQKLTRANLQRNSYFEPIFREEIERIRQLQVKCIRVDSDEVQYLLELYIAIEYELDLTEFGNH